MHAPDDALPDDDSAGDFPPEGWEAMSLAEQDEAVCAHRERLARRRERLAAQGDEAAYLVAEVDADLALLDAALAEVAPLRQEVDAAQEALLQAGANVADGRLDFYLKLNAMAEWMARQFPDDPKAGALKLICDDIAKEIPRDQVRPERSMAELEKEMREQGFMEPPPAG